MKKFKLSGFDLGMVIAAVVVALLGGGAWWYLSGSLADAQTETTAAKSDFDKYSSNPKYHVVVSEGNAKILQTNIDLVKTQLLPVVQARFRSKDNKLSSIEKEDPVAWKHDLDDDVHRMNAAAKTHNIGVPQNFYFGFSRYLSQSPNDQQTAVLSKQLLGVETIADILIGAQVKDIVAFRRTYEEDPRPTNVNPNTPGASTEGDHLAGYSTNAGGDYTVYPFEIEFDATPENFRTVLNGLIQSPYIFIVRSLDVKSSNPTSPAINDLDRMAGTPPSSVISSNPGEVAATASTVGPQYLFGNATVGVKARIDLIEWTSDPALLSSDADQGGSGPGHKGPSPKPSNGSGK